MTTEADEGKVEAEIEMALHALEQEWGVERVAPIRPIVFANKKRLAQQFRPQGQGPTAEAYVRHVAATYERLNPYMDQIQIARDEGLWRPLREQLQLWAYNYLLGCGFRPDDDASQLADEYAHEAAIRLLAARFPYDGDFEPWAHVLVMNTCRIHMKAARRPSQVPGEVQTPLADATGLLLPEAMNEHQWQQVRLELLDAIERLPEASWRQVLYLHYFGGLKPKEIAEVMDRTPAAIYALHVKAMVALRKIFIEKGYKDE